MRMTKTVDIDIWQPPAASSGKFIPRGTNTHSGGLLTAIRFPNRRRPAEQPAASLGPPYPERASCCRPMQRPCRSRATPRGGLTPFAPAPAIRVHAAPRKAASAQGKAKEKEFDAHVRIRKLHREGPRAAPRLEQIPYRVLLRERGQAE